jgi:hypothetical protein
LPRRVEQHPGLHLLLDIVPRKIIQMAAHPLRDFIEPTAGRVL